MQGQRADQTAPDARGWRFAIVVSRFHHEITEGLFEGAVEVLVGSGVDRQDIEAWRVPGAWELPFALDRVLEAREVDGAIALGALVRGETSHFDVLCREAARGLSTVSHERGVPVGFGLLTCETIDQARERSQAGPENKGREAALAALEMVALARRLSGSDRR